MPSLFSKALASTGSAAGGSVSQASFQTLWPWRRLEMGLNKRCIQMRSYIWIFPRTVEFVADLGGNGVYPIAILMVG